MDKFFGGYVKLYNEEISKKELLKKVGDISQIGGIKLYEMIDGVSRGVRVANIKNAIGIDMNVIIDRGLDISDLRFNSIPIAWKSAVKETSPVYYESRGFEWLRTFYGGLLTTCGLTYAGIPCVDNGEELGLHGRIANLSAENIFTDFLWDEDNCLMSIQGVVREAKVFGDKLENKRKITVWMNKPKIVVEDTIENIGSDPSPLMIIYHINIGFPVLDSSSILLESEAIVAPRDHEAEKGLKEYNRFSKPAPGFKEQVFSHDIKADNEGNSNIAIVNEKFNNGNGIGIWVKYNKNNLPLLGQWKNMGCGEYVCGIEPSNCNTSGRKENRDCGELKFIEPGEKKNFRIEFNILNSIEQINNLKKIL